MGLFKPNIGKLVKRRDYWRLADLLADPELADEAATALVGLGSEAFEPVFEAAKRAWKNLEQLVFENSEYLSQHVWVLRAYVVVLTRFENPSAVPFLVKVFAYAANGASPPPQLLDAIEQSDKAELERLNDPEYWPDPTQELHRTSVHKRVFLHTRACSSLLDAIEQGLMLFKNQSSGQLKPFLQDHRPPVQQAAQKLLNRISAK